VLAELEQNPEQAMKGRIEVSVKNASSLEQALKIAEECANKHVSP